MIDGYRTQMTLFCRNPLILLAIRTDDPLFSFLAAKMVAYEANNGFSVRENEKNPVLFTIADSLSERSGALGQGGMTCVEDGKFRRDKVK
ncbi:hypothetical protein ACF3MZ_18960 [Paenibacillaceae bacterium WGS1546]|uniref:hypothetical protein n=1 Tax=Cohnella sp. WGS1546 TaxID=3366810 RepID=UPI00372D1CAA